MATMHSTSCTLRITCLLLLFWCGCKADSSDQKRGIQARAQHEAQVQAQAQAIVKTLTEPYDPANPSTPTSSYVEQAQVDVPQDLRPQNKWFMFEGPVLENELVAYRFYADSRHRFDIYGKLVPDLVMDTVGWAYHDIMDWGSDILKVGQTLGLGSPAIFYKDSLYTLSNAKQKSIQVLSTDSESAHVRTTLKGFSLGEAEFTVIQDWTLETGSPWSTLRLTINHSNLPDEMLFATGMAKHLPDIEEVQTNGQFCIYNWGDQSFHKQQLGMAICASLEQNPQRIHDELNHAIAFANASQQVEYKFAAVWEKDQNKIQTQREFATLITQGSDDQM